MEELFCDAKRIFELVYVSEFEVTSSVARRFQIYFTETNISNYCNSALFVFNLFYWYLP